MHFGLDAGKDALHRYGDTVSAAAEMVRGYGIKLGIEHFPARALDTAISK